MKQIHLYKRKKFVKINVIRVCRRTPGNFTLSWIDVKRCKKCFENGLK